MASPDWTVSPEQGVLWNGATWIHGETERSRPARIGDVPRLTCMRRRAGRVSPAQGVLWCVSSNGATWWMARGAESPAESPTCRDWLHGVAGLDGVTGARCALLRQFPPCGA